LAHAELWAFLFLWPAMWNGKCGNRHGRCEMSQVSSFGFRQNMMATLLKKAVVIPAGPLRQLRAHTNLEVLI
jgi:hypothetical protein